MTDAPVGLLIFGVAILLLFWRKKRPQVMFFEVFEWVEVKRKPRLPGFLVNMMIAAGIAAFIWIMNR